MHTLRYISFLLLLTLISVSAQTTWEQENTSQQQSFAQQDVEDVSIDVYPNPTADYVFLRIKQASASYVLTNLIGKTIFTGIVDNGQAIIDLTNQHKGIYILKIFDQYQMRITTRKIIKE